MIVATFYRPATGEILRTMRLVDADEVEMNRADDEAWFEGTADRKTQQVIGGQVVARDSDVLEAEAIADAWIKLRQERNSRLMTCDWTQVADAPVDHAAWAIYRQALRDLPDLTIDPRTPVWPTPPI